MEETVIVNGKAYTFVKLLGHGKGGYSYLVKSGDQLSVLKQIHHEPCDYYTFGNKIEAEYSDYQRLKEAGIRIPEMFTIDLEKEIVIKEYIEGDTVFEMIAEDKSVENYLPQVKEMAASAKAHGMNIDYFPTNFVVNSGLLWYVDYECNDYMEEGNFDNWGSRYWAKSEEFKEYLNRKNEH